jgi:hypothetical protein
MNGKPIAVVIDTNRNEGSRDTSSFSNFRFGRYDSYADYIEENDLVEEVHLFLPEIVVKESIKHLSEELKSCVDHINQQLLRINGVFSGVIESVDITSDNRKGYIDQIEKRIRKNARLIPIPEITVSFFSSLLERAIYKKPPFKKGDSDPGFKDAVIWESVCNFFSKNRDYSEIYLFTKDSGFTSNVDKLRDECLKKTGITLRVIEEADLILFVSNKYKKHLDFIRYLNEVFYSEFTNSKVGSLLLRGSNSWLVHSIIINETPAFVNLDDKEAEILLDCSAEVSQFNEMVSKKIDVSLAFEVKFIKDQDSNWQIKNENFVGLSVL